MRDLAQEVGLPINPPRRNVNSRLALETIELVRDRSNDQAAAGLHHALSGAFFVDGADIADIGVVSEYAKTFGGDEADVRAAWASRTYADAVDASIRAASAAGVRGVPAFGWPGSGAVSGMMRPEQIVAILRPA